MAAQRTAADRGCEFVRIFRNQCACAHRGGASGGLVACTDPPSQRAARIEYCRSRRVRRKPLPCWLLGIATGWTRIRRWRLRTSARRPEPARSHFEHRAALVVDSRGQGTTTARRAARGPSGAGSDARACVVIGRRPHGCFRDRAASSQEWREACSRANRSSARPSMRCADVLDGVLPRSSARRDVRRSGREEDLRDTTFAQPALFAVELALASAVAVVGHLARRGAGS